MRFVDEFRNRNLAQGLIQGIRRLASKRVNLMEVCGTHTVTIYKHGIKELLPPAVNMLSGPGCPVCVTPTVDVDKAIALTKNSHTILATFGDMMKVPGSDGSLEQERAEGADIRVVYSSLDALRIARENKDMSVVFFAIGFETTSPTIACSLLEAHAGDVSNFLILCGHKLIPPAMRALLEAKEVNIDGFICPGHVSTIIGSSPYEFAARNYQVPCVVAGFEPLDVLQAIYMLLKQIDAGEPRVEIQYTRCVRPEGNPLAQRRLYEVFETCDSEWRGMGVIPESGLRLREEFSQFDATRVFDIQIEEVPERSDCICGKILRGVATPHDCPLFAAACTPTSPIGPCMVSSEGTCSTYYKYNRR